MNSQLVVSDTNKLTREEIDHFHFQGFLGPYPSFTPEVMKNVSEELYGDVFKTAGPNPTKGLETTQCRHLDSPLVYSMVSHPAIVRRICCLLGEDLMIWISRFWIKEPHGKGLETPWHQDINYWPLEPQVNITCWIAIDEVTAENAPLRIIPGSHRHMVSHVDVAAKDLSTEADSKQVDEAKAKTLIMKPGEFVLFSEKLLHGSPANTSSRRRCALAGRYTLPSVRLFPNEAPLNFPGYHALMLSGQDRFHWNPFGSPPLG